LGAEQEIKQIMIIPKQQAEKIEINAKNNHQKAVNDVLDMIFNRSEK
jgi:hypothetical protein